MDNVENVLKELEKQYEKTKRIEFLQLCLLCGKKESSYKILYSNCINQLLKSENLSKDHLYFCDWILQLYSKKDIGKTIVKDLDLVITIYEKFKENGKQYVASAEKNELNLPKRDSCPFCMEPLCVSFEFKNNCSKGHYYGINISNY